MIANTNAETTQPAQSQHPALELLARYRAVFATAWAHRAELAESHAPGPCFRRY